MLPSLYQPQPILRSFLEPIRRTVAESNDYNYKDTGSQSDSDRHLGVEAIALYLGKAYQQKRRRGMNIQYRLLNRAAELFATRRTHQPVQQIAPERRVKETSVSNSLRQPARRLPLPFGLIVWEG